MNPSLQPGANEYLVKYFGCVEVELGTGIETVQTSVEVSNHSIIPFGYMYISVYI